MTESQRIVITGASAGIGAALARTFAAPGVHLYLCARGAKQLETVAGVCRTLGAEVVTARVDLRAPKAGPDWIRSIEAEGPIDTLVLNAGVFSGRPAPNEIEPLASIPGLITTNLIAPLLCATCVAPAMRARGAGRIVLISSLAGISPSPDSPSYSASKAGLSAFGKALADDLAGSGVRVHLVEPGHIHTKQTEQQLGCLPLAISADTAAARIFSAIERDKARIAFPWPAQIYVHLINALPRRVRLLLNRSQRFSVLQDPNGGT